MGNRRGAIRVIVVLLVGGFLVLRYGVNLRPRGLAPAAPAVARPGARLFSGTVQADQVLLGAEYGGRVAEVAVEEGDAVRQGQVLLRLDATLADDQVAVAEAELAVAQAGLDRLQAGARPSAVAVARAQEAQAVAARDAAHQALADAQEVQRTPQELALQAAVVRGQLAAAEARVQQAAALRDLAQMGVEGLEYLRRMIDEWAYPVESPSIPLAVQEAPYDLWLAWSALNAASAARDGAREQLLQLEAQLAAPQALTTQADATAAALAQAEAGVEVARAQVAALVAAPSAEQLAAAEARVAQARAALEALRLQRSRMEILAPLDGTVLVRQVEPGEVAAPGAPLLSMGSLQQVALILYVPEADLGRVRLGQGVRVSVDSYAGRTFAGQVIHIADEAEFTPRNVATEEERINTLFAVKVRLPNPDGALKPGMPADATFEEGQG